MVLPAANRSEITAYWTYGWSRHCAAGPPNAFFGVDGYVEHAVDSIPTRSGLIAVRSRKPVCGQKFGGGAVRAEMPIAPAEQVVNLAWRHVEPLDRSAFAEATGATSKALHRQTF